MAVSRDQSFLHKAVEYVEAEAEHARAVEDLRAATARANGLAERLTGLKAALAEYVGPSVPALNAMHRGKLLRVERIASDATKQPGVRVVVEPLIIGGK